MSPSQSSGRGGSRRNLRRVGGGFDIFSKRQPRPQTDNRTLREEKPTLVAAPAMWAGGLRGDMRERQIQGGSASSYPSDGDMTLYDYAVMLRTDLDNAKKTIIKLRNDCKGTDEVKRQLMEAREALDASLESGHAAEIREHENRRRYEQNLHKLNLVKEKVQAEKEILEQKLETERQAQVDLVIALQAEIRFAQSKYKAVREELNAAVAGWDHERKRVSEIQSYWHHNQALVSQDSKPKSDDLIDISVLRGT